MIRLTPAPSPRTQGWTPDTLFFAQNALKVIFCFHPCLLDYLPMVIRKGHDSDSMVYLLEGMYCLLGKNWHQRTCLCDTVHVISWWRGSKKGMKCMLLNSQSSWWGAVLWPFHLGCPKTLSQQNVWGFCC